MFRQALRQEANMRASSVRVANTEQNQLPASMVASIVAPGQLRPAPCVVQEVSPEGARLRLDENWIIPKLFWLRIEGDARLHYCKVAWRSGKALGVEFPREQDQWWSKFCDRDRINKRPMR